MISVPDDNTTGDKILIKPVATPLSREAGGDNGLEGYEDPVMPHAFKAGVGLRTGGLAHMQMAEVLTAMDGMAGLSEDWTGPLLSSSAVGAAQLLQPADERQGSFAEIDDFLRSEASFGELVELIEGLEGIADVVLSRVMQRLKLRDISELKDLYIFTEGMQIQGVEDSFPTIVVNLTQQDQEALNELLDRCIGLDYDDKGNYIGEGVRGYLRSQGRSILPSETRPQQWEIAALDPENREFLDERMRDLLWFSVLNTRRLASSDDSLATFLLRRGYRDVDVRDMIPEVRVRTNRAALRILNIQAVRESVDLVWGSLESSVQSGDALYDLMKVRKNTYREISWKRPSGEIDRDVQALFLEMGNPIDGYFANLKSSIEYTEGIEMPSLAESLLNYRVPLLESDALREITLEAMGRMYSLSGDQGGDGVQSLNPKRLKYILEDEAAWCSLIANARQIFEEKGNLHEWETIRDALIVSRQIHMIVQFLGGFLMVPYKERSRWEDVGIDERGRIAIGGEKPEREHLRLLGDRIATCLRTIPDMLVADGKLPEPQGDNRFLEISPDLRELNEQVVQPLYDFNRWLDETTHEATGASYGDYMRCIQLIGYMTQMRVKEQGLRAALLPQNPIQDAELNGYLDEFGVEIGTWEMFVENFLMEDVRNAGGTSRTPRYRAFTDRKVVLPKGIQDSRIPWTERTMPGHLLRASRSAYRALVHEYNQEASDRGFIPLESHSFGIGDFKFGKLEQNEKSIDRAVIKEIFRQVALMLYLSPARSIGDDFDTWYKSMLGFFVVSEDSFLNLESLVIRNGVARPNLPKKGAGKGTIAAVQLRNVSAGANGYGFYEDLETGLEALREWVLYYFESKVQGQI